jgi:tight adherence protein C
MIKTLDLIEIASGYLTLQIGGISLGPVETAILILALAAALVSALNLWRISKHEDRRERLSLLRGAPLEAARIARGPRSHWYDRLGIAVAASPVVGATEQHRLLNSLAAAGIKGHGDLPIFVAGKVCGAVALAAALWLFLEWRHLFAGILILRLALIFGALMLGWRLPDFILSRLAARRRVRIEIGLPDALDLLVICAEAGLSLDQGIEQVGHDLRASNPEVAEEFATTAAEMRVLSDRSAALENLVKRTGLAGLRSVTATLSQAIRFGTPLAESMRILAAEMRSARLARIEERAARLPVLLALPLMAFIMPSLLMVIGTPVALRIVDFLKHFTIGAAP